MTHRNQHINKLGLKRSTIRGLFKLFFAVLFTVMTIQAVQYYIRLAYYQWRDANIVAPCPNFCNSMFKVATVYAEDSKTVDELVDEAATKYGKTKWLQLRTKTLLHYLLLRESAYGNTQACGDDGKACGPLQFWAGTYTANAKRMMLLGLRDHIGNRLDFADSIDVAAWMINEGQEKQWGPVLRGEIKL